MGGTTDFGSSSRRRRSDVVGSLEHIDDLNISIDKNNELMKAKKLSLKKNSKKTGKMPIKRGSKRASGIIKSKSSSNFGKLGSIARLKNKVIYILTELRRTLFSPLILTKIERNKVN